MTWFAGLTVLDSTAHDIRICQMCSGISFTHVFRVCSETNSLNTGTTISKTEMCLRLSVFESSFKTSFFYWINRNLFNDMYLQILYFSRRILTFVSLAIVRKYSHCTAVPAESWGINWNESLASPIEGMFRMSRVWSICLVGCGMCVSERGCLARGAVGMNLNEQSVGRSSWWAPIGIVRPGSTYWALHCSLFQSCES